MNVTAKLIVGNVQSVISQIPDKSVHCCVTSPPYWGLRNYGHTEQIGLEDTPDKYVAKIVDVFREVRRVLRDDGTLWLNLGDSYNGIGGPGKQNGGPIGPTAAVAIEGTKGRRISGLKPKDLVGIPWRVAFALQADGWWLRQDIIWNKPNPTPESVRDRCTKAHEYIFLLSKSEKYYFDSDAMKEPAVSGPAGNVSHRLTNAYIAGDETLRTKAGLVKFAQKQRDGKCKLTRNKRSVWTVATKPFKGAHFATFPTKLVEPCILAGSPEGGVVFDPFTGSGTTGLAALQLHRSFIGIELNQEYANITQHRWKQATKQHRMF